ncbi:MAG: hypothetical protein QM762_25920 [Chryseolinea sp.]
MKIIRRTRFLCLVLIILQFLIAPALQLWGNSDEVVVASTHHSSQHMSICEVEESGLESSFVAIDDKMHVVLYSLNVIPNYTPSFAHIHARPPSTSRSLFSLFCTLLI